MPRIYYIKRPVDSVRSMAIRICSFLAANMRLSMTYAFHWRLSSLNSSVLFAFVALSIPLFIQCFLHRIPLLIFNLSLFLSFSLIDFSFLPFLFLLSLKMRHSFHRYSHSLLSLFSAHKFQHIQHIESVQMRGIGSIVMSRKWPVCTTRTQRANERERISTTTRL